jgi:hypothetical protein
MPSILTIKLVTCWLKQHTWFKRRLAGEFCYLNGGYRVKTGINPSLRHDSESNEVFSGI